MSRTLGGTVRAAVDFLGKIDRGEHSLGDRSIIGWGPLLPQNEAGRQQRKNGETQCPDVASRPASMFSFQTRS